MNRITLLAVGLLTGLVLLMCARSRKRGKPAPDQTSAVGSEPADQQTVYISTRGTKYHRWGCRFLGKNNEPMTLPEAVARNYSPCKLCMG
jgi:hypothetical protein